MSGPAIWLILAAAVLPSEEQQAQISAPYERCLDAQAARLDDGHSDIAVLGRAAEDGCKSESERMKAAMGKNLGPEDREKLRASLEWIIAGTGTVAIAKHRQHRTNP